MLTTPLLLSWDGEKMSSSIGNNIPLTEPPEEMFGQTMRIPDELLPRLVAARRRAASRRAGEPMESKLALARLIVARSHGEEAARAAEDHFTRVVRRHEAPDDVPEVALPDGDPVHLPALLVASFGVDSTSEARRLIRQGGVKVDGEAVTARRPTREARRGVLQVGKRDRRTSAPGLRFSLGISSTSEARRLIGQGGVKSTARQCGARRPERRLTGPCSRWEAAFRALD